MFIPDPDFYPSRIPDLGSRISDPGSRIPDLWSWLQQKQQKRKEGKISCPSFFCSRKYHKIKIYFILELVKKIIIITQLYYYSDWPD